MVQGCAGIQDRFALFDAMRQTKGGPRKKAIPCPNQAKQPGCGQPETDPAKPAQRSGGFVPRHQRTNLALHKQERSELSGLAYQYLFWICDSCRYLICLPYYHDHVRSWFLRLALVGLGPLLHLYHLIRHRCSTTESVHSFQMPYIQHIPQPASTPARLPCSTQCKN